MNSKNKGKTFVGIILVAILIVILIIYSYISQKVSYASTLSEDKEETKISNAEKINIDKIIKQNQKESEEQIITEEVNLEYITIYKNNNDLPKGTMQVVQEGRTGKQQITKKITIDENGEKHEEEINSITVISEVNKIVEIGTSKTKRAYKISKGSEIYVTSDRADIMKQNSLDSAKATTVQKNTKMKVLSVEDNWYKVSIDGQIGWIKSENVASIYTSPDYQETTPNKVLQCNIEMPLNQPSGLTLEQFKKILTDPKDKNNIFSENAEYFYYIEQQYNINGIFVAAIGIHESAWGTSKIAKNKKNLFGYRAYDSSPYSSASTFSSYSEGIDLVARLLVKYYLNPKGTTIYNGEKAVGTYYNGNTVADVNKKYATDKNWSKKVYKYMEYLYQKI